LHLSDSKVTPYYSHQLVIVHLK